MILLQKPLVMLLISRFSVILSEAKDLKALAQDDTKIIAVT
ncbi:exported hypothetical protein [Candidatus Desulfosporosinus infrequens]|uniref:Uncharacterized protein n=1 Tax=Candidatus Desulfosporosinus infrequens TaxID=2043169 RepID=A0A2U3LPN6_9FIRM|nr:exported hypothetical protein [Candidatus Desulfosporosinus infrequens]